METFCSTRWKTADQHDPLASLRNGSSIGQMAINFHAFPAGSLVGVDFRTLSLAGSDFSGQDLTCARFHLSMLGRPTFCSGTFCVSTDEQMRAQGLDEGYIQRSKSNRSGPGNGFGQLHSSASFVGAKLDHTDFSDAILDGADFSYASLSCASFAGTDLTHALLPYPVDISATSPCRTDFGHRARLTLLEIRTIGIGTPSHTNWPLVSFNDVQVAREGAAPVPFAHLDMSGAQLEGSDLDGLNFTASNLCHADLHGAHLNRADLSEIIGAGADFSSAQLRSSSITHAQLYVTGQGTSSDHSDPATSCPWHRSPSDLKTTETSFEGARLDDAQLTGARLDHASFRFAVLTGANLNSVSLRGAHFSSNEALDPASVVNASFEQADFSEAGVSAVDFSGDDLMGAKFTRDTLRGTSFAGARLTSADFTEATLDNVNFRSAQLFAVKFTGTLFTRPTAGETGAGSNLSCTRLGGADFTNARLDYANLADAAMPTADDCCRTADGVTCGFTPQNGAVYHETILPRTTSGSITCPNGDHGPCLDLQWKVSNWTSANCSADGQPTRLWSRPACRAAPSSNGDSSDGLAFADPALRRCILSQLHKRGTITQDDADGITSLDCPAMEIASTQGIEQLRNLTSLKLVGNRLGTFSVAAHGLPRLVTLDVTANQLTSLSLLRLPRLQNLYAARNQLQDVLFFEPASPHLQLLDLSSNQLTKLDLTQFRSLQFAYLSNNRLSSVVDGAQAPLAALTHLSELTLDQNLLDTVGDVTGMLESDRSSAGKLSTLTLSCNPHFQCSTLGSNDGTRYHTLSNTGCVKRSDPSAHPWIFLDKPDCGQ